MKAPQKPFDGYKWRWATVTCTESLNEPPVFLGVLRVLRRFEGMLPSDGQLLQRLRKVESETNTYVKLARDASRNIIRNSGQYWKALDVLEGTSKGIELTEFGKKVADGDITPTEFATTVIKTLELPNRRIDNKSDEWGKLKIKPLQLIIDILAKLTSIAGEEMAYITPS